MTEKKESFDKFKKSLGDLYKKLKLNQKNIEILVKENNELNNKINKIINSHLNIINIFLKIFSLLFIISCIVIVGNVSNFNFLALVFCGITTPLTTIFFNVYIKDLLKQRYRKKNQKIKFLEILINENNFKIDELKRISVRLLNDIVEISNSYSKSVKINLTQNIIKKTENYCTDLFIKPNVIYNGENNHLVKIKKLKNKTRK